MDGASSGGAYGRRKKAKTPKEKRTTTKSVVETILKIWSHRTDLPGDTYPLARYREVLKVLESMAPSAETWRRNAGQNYVFYKPTERSYD